MSDVEKLSEMELGERPEHEDLNDSDDSSGLEELDDGYEENPPEPVNVSPFAQALLKKKKEIGRSYAHNAFYYKHSAAKNFLELKKKDHTAKLFLAGSYAWVPDATKIYEPAKVVEDIEFSEERLKRKRKEARTFVPAIGKSALVNSRGNTTKAEPESETLGKLVMLIDGKPVLKNVNAKAARNLIPMQSLHLQPTPYFDINVDDLSPASLMYNVRFQFEEKNSECVQVGDNTLIYVNRNLNQVEEMMRDNKPKLDPGGFAEKLYNNLNKSGGTQPQSCVIVGNKESNRRNVSKTVATKLIQKGAARDANWFERLQAADEILSVFGGENFIRWTELHMNYATDAKQAEKKGKLIGAAFQSFLLNTANIINKNSTSFDIFHQICAASTHGNQEEKENKNSSDVDLNSGLEKLFGIKSSERYFYLNNGKEVQHRFKPEEIKEYFEDPEERKKKLEEKRKADEERIRQAKIDKQNEKDAKAAEKLRVENERRAAREKGEKLKKEREKQKEKRKVGKVNTSIFTNQMKQTNSNKKTKKLCSKSDCENPAFGIEDLCQKCFFAKSSSGGETMVVAKGKQSTAVKEKVEETPQEKPERSSKSNDLVEAIVESPNQKEIEEEVKQEEEIEEEEEEEEEVEESEPAHERWEKTLENLALLNIKEKEIYAMVKLLSDILEIGNIRVCDTERVDGKAKQVAIVDRASDDEKDEDIVKKSFQIDDLTKKQVNSFQTKMFKETKETVDVNEEGQLLKNVAVNFLVEKKRAKKFLFGVKLLHLVEILNNQQLKFGAETLWKKVPKNKCLARRDALVRALYAGMFNWLLHVMNRGVSYTEDAKNKTKADNGQVGIIAILETIGLMPELTNLETNGLEQLINNYAQEKIHSFYTIQILEKHAEVYKTEKFQLSFPVGNELVLPLILGQVTPQVEQKKPLRPKNNRASFTRSFALIDLRIRDEGNRSGPVGQFAKTHTKTLGILDLCQEQIIAPKGSDKALLNRITKEHPRHENLLLAKGHRNFKIKHFGAKVNYNVKGFLVGTWSSVLDDEVKTFILNNTTDGLVKKLLTEHSIAKQQKKMDEIYKTGMQQINLGIISEKIATQKKNEAKGPLIFSRHSVSAKNSRMLRESFTGETKVAPTPIRPIKRKERHSVARGLVGMTMTLNLAGLKRERNASLNNQPLPTEGIVKQPSMQAMPIEERADSIGTTAPAVAPNKGRARANNQKKQANTKDGLRLVHNTMNTLIVMLDLTQPHFIHCVPSNAEGKKDKMEPAFVFEHLKVSGIIPFYGTRFKEWSFGNGFDFDYFKQQHRPLNVLLKPDNLSNPSLYMKNLQEVGLISSNQWKVGAEKNRIYLKLGTLSEVQTLSETAFEDLVTFIQKYWRMSLIRKLYFQLLEEKFKGLLEDASEENDLKTLQTVVGKCRWYRIATREMHIAEGKIKKLREELRLRNKLKKVTEKENLGLIFQYLHIAKDKQLPPCEELSAAYNKYLKLNSEAEKMATEGQKERKKMFRDVVEEFKEQKEFDATFDVDEFIKDLRKKQKEMDAEAFRKQSSASCMSLTRAQPKLDKFLERTSVRLNPKNKNRLSRNFRSTARFNAISREDMEKGRKSHRLEADFDDIDDEESIDELDDEYDETHANAWATSKTRSVASMSQATVQSATTSVDLAVTDEANKQNGSMLDNLLKGKNKKKGRSGRGSFLNFFSSSRRNSEGDLNNAGAIKSKTRIGSFVDLMRGGSVRQNTLKETPKKKQFILMRFFSSFRSKRTVAKQDSLADLREENEMRKMSEVSVDLDSEDSLVRMPTTDVASEPPRVADNRRMFGTVRSIFRKK